MCKTSITISEFIAESLRIDCPIKQKVNVSIHPGCRKQNKKHKKNKWGKHNKILLRLGGANTASSAKQK